jgi:hypothetical protein
VKLAWLRRGDKFAREALRLDPAGFRARREYMSAITPRWGGSHDAMQRAVFLDGFDSDNPAGRGYVAEMRGDKTAARIDYERALELEEMAWVARRLAKLGDG